MLLRSASLAILLAVPPLLALAAPAAAAELSAEGQQCVGAQSAALAKQVKKAARELTRCVKRAGRGRQLDERDPGVQSVDACVLADPRGKLAKLGEKAAARLERACPDPLPAFGVSDAATASARASAAAVGLVRDVLGPDLGPGALAMERRDAKCQQAAWQASAGCQRARLRAFARCQRDALRGGADSPQGLSEGCLGAGAEPQPDPKGKIARACADPRRGLARAVAKRCDGLDVFTLLPPCGMAADPTACLAAHAACRTCEVLAISHRLARDCDLFDDGVANASCSGGPTLLSCVSPAQGAMLALPDGAGATFLGHLQGGLGIDEVSVEGVPVPVAEDGSFEAPVATAFGTNFVSLEAEDALGRPYATTCGFVASEAYLAEDAFLADAFSLKLGQAAVDDGSRSGAIGSLGDVVHAVVNSNGLRNALHAALLAANPLKPNACDETVLGVCVLRSQIVYNSSTANGAHDASLTLVANGLGASATIRNVVLDVRASGHVAGIPYDTTGTATFASIALGQVLDVGLAGDSVTASVRGGSTSVSVGAISTSFSGLDGAIVNLAVTLLQGPVKNLLSSTLSGFLEDQLGGVLGSLLDGLDPPDTLAPVPRLGGGAIALLVESAWSALSVSSERARFGLGSRLGAADDHGLPSLGVPLVPSPTSDDPPTSEPALLAARVDALNQALHALWRGGLLHGALMEGDAPSLPAGFVAELEASLPPVATGLTGDELALALGALRALVTLPGVFDVPTQLAVGAEATARLQIVDDRLVFSDPAVTAVHLAGVDASLDAGQQALLETVVGAVLERLLADALAAGALGLAIPAFEVSPEAAAYGLPLGGEIGIVDPTLTTTPSHAHAEGPIGLR